MNKYFAVYLCTAYCTVDFTCVFRALFSQGIYIKNVYNSFLNSRLKITVYFLADDVIITTSSYYLLIKHFLRCLYTCTELCLFCALVIILLVWCCFFTAHLMELHFILRPVIIFKSWLTGLINVSAHGIHI